MMYTKSKVLLWLIILLPNSLWSQQIFSLEEAVAYGIEHRYDLQSQRLDIEIQDAQNREILANAYPQITGSSNFTYNYKKQVVLFPDFVTPSIYGVLLSEGILQNVDPNKLDPNNLSPVSFVQNYGFTGQLQLQQLLFEPTLFVGLKARDASMELATEKVAKSELDIKEAINKAYYSVLLGRANLKLVNANITLLDSLYYTTNAIYKAGLAEQLDVDKIKVQLNNLANEKVKAENFLSVSEYSLKFNMAYPFDQELQLKDSLDEKFLEDLDAYLEEPITAEQSLDFKILEINQRLAELNIMRYKYTRYPTLSFFANYGFNSPSNEFNYFSRDAEYFGQGMMGLNLSIPILTSGGTKSRITQAQLQQQQLSLAVDNLRLSYKLQNENLKTNLRNALISLKNQEENIRLAKKIYDMSRIKYETGVGSSLEIIQTNTDLQKAQTAYLQALYEAILAKVNILKASNKL